MVEDICAYCNRRSSPAALDDGKNRRQFPSLETTAQSIPSDRAMIEAVSEETIDKLTFQSKTTTRKAKMKKKKSRLSNPDRISSHA